MAASDPCASPTGAAGSSWRARLTEWLRGRKRPASGSAGLRDRALEQPLRWTHWMSVLALLAFGIWYAAHAWHDAKARGHRDVVGAALLAAVVADAQLAPVQARLEQAALVLARSPPRRLHATLSRLAPEFGGDLALVQRTGPTARSAAGVTLAARAGRRGLVMTHAVWAPPRAWPAAPDVRLQIVPGAPGPLQEARSATAPLAHLPFSAQATLSRHALALRFWAETRALFAFLLASLAATFWIHAYTLGRQRRWQVARETAAATLAREKELAEITLHSIADAVIITGVDGHITSMNAVAEHLTGYQQHDALGAPLLQVFRIVDEATRKHVPDLIQRALRHGDTSDLTRNLLIARHGTEYMIEHSAAPIRNAQRQIFGAVLVFHDVTDRHRLTAALIHQARHDYLTGLPNRQTLEDNLDRACRMIRDDVRHILLYLDLDQLKVINDSCGHAAGDELLRQTSKILSMHVRATDIVARLGGDEFAVLLHRCDLDQGHTVAENLLHAIRRHRFLWQEKVFALSASMGLVVLDNTMSDAASALSAADSACYLAKEQGRNRVCTYKASDQAVSRYREGMNWINEVTEALENNRLRLYRQKIVPTVGAATVDEYEVLMRLERANGELVSPSLFIPSVERYGIMPNLDRWVIRTLLRHLDQSESTGTCGCHYAVNISGTSLNDDFFLDFVLEHLRTVHVHCIRFEITETAAITNFPRAQHFISQLRSKGCRFSLDDFGSGLSSFTYLRNLAIDAIKIDGSFIKDIAHDAISYAIVKSITQVAHDMGLKTVAEFVEDQATLGPLREIGVDYVQGHAIHAPEPL